MAHIFTRNDAAAIGVRFAASLSGARINSRWTLRHWLPVALARARTLKDRGRVNATAAAGS